MHPLRRLLSPRGKTEFNVQSRHHTHFCTPDTGRLLMEREGFAVLRITTASWARTLLRLFSLRNFLVGSFLWVADKTHRGGNVNEIYAIRGQSAVQRLMIRPCPVVRLATYSGLSAMNS